MTGPLRARLLARARAVADRLRSLTARLVLTAVVLALAVSVLLGTATTLVMRHALTERLDSEVRSTLSSVLETPPTPPGVQQQTRVDLRNLAPGTLIALLEPGSDPQAIVVGDGRGERDTLDDRVASRLEDVDPDGRVEEVPLGRSGDYLVAATTVGESTVVVGLPTRDVDDAVAQLVLAEVLLGALVTLLAAAAAGVVVRRQLRPLTEVAATAHRVAALPLESGEIELAERVPERLTDERTEAGAVGAALNTLLAHVESSLTARHRSEQQVRQFVADASHELRTPLATIAGYTELAQRRPDDTGTQRTALTKVAEESVRMTALVEDLLLLARLDSGRPLEQQPVDLTRLLLEAVSDARVLAPSHHWRLELPEDVVEVVGDDQRLHQVVTNLLTNARKHTPEGSTITVAATPTGFTVHDDGPGFDPELAERAFERFVRGDASRTRGGVDPGGAGLGLSLVEAIVAAHGGTVLLTSAPGDTTIEVRLPVAVG